ncbi:MAG: Transcription factor iws1 [Peltula sp. TS41687]|nr:MAG: Transcription factor iws1 [Peltula sp. TS41687]
MAEVDSEHRPETPLPEAGHDASDPNQPIEEDLDTPAAPPANPHLDMDDLDNRLADLSDDESDLSEIDEAQFDDFDPTNVAVDDRPAIAVDDSNVALLGVHKRKRDEGAADGAGGTGEEGVKPKKKKEGRREKPKKNNRKNRDLEEDDFSGGEELTGKRERKKKPPGIRKERAKPRKATPEKEEDFSLEERRRRALDRAMDEALKNPNRRRRKLTGVDLEAQQDALIEEVRKKMVNAARSDNDARKEGRIATEKLRLLPQVVDLLNRKGIQPAIVDPDSGIIEAVKFFLEPLSDGSLPAYNVQRDLFDALSKLPITSDTLITTGIGKVALFYTKSKRPQEGIKRIAERLLGEWSRPILKRSDDYREKTKFQVDFDPSKAEELYMLERRLAKENQEGPPKPPPTEEEEERPERTLARARVVNTGPVTYEIAPKNILPGHRSHTNRRVGAAAERWMRQLKARQVARYVG